MPLECLLYGTSHHVSRLASRCCVKTGPFVSPPHSIEGARLPLRGCGRVCLLPAPAHHLACCQLLLQTILPLLPVPGGWLYFQRELLSRSRQQGKDGLLQQLAARDCVLCIAMRAFGWPAAVLAVWCGL